MNSQDLRIGNIISVCYEKEINSDDMIVLEPHVVLLSKWEYTDGDQGIIGVTL